MSERTKCWLGIGFLIIVLLGCQPPDDKGIKIDVDDRMSFFEVLKLNDSLNLNVKTDLDQLIAAKDSSDNQFQPADFWYTAGQSASDTMSLEVRPRGVTRKKICEMPPMMLKMPKKVRKEKRLRKTDNIKIVAPCKAGDEYQEIVYKEYLCYKLFNVITDSSYQVEFVDLNYVDKQGQQEDMTRKGFLIEPTDEMSDRISCQLLETKGKVKRIQKEFYKRFVLFQYMIGNTDWNMTERHNIRLLQCGKETGPLPIPYDFDYSGLVNADYATPHPMLPIQKVTERLFQWRGSVEEDFSSTYEVFQSKKTELINTILDFEHLSTDAKADMIAYLDIFFAEIKDANVMKKAMLKARGK